MTSQEQALEWVEEQRVKYNRVGNHYVQDVLKLCKQALQSQAEKDRVMVLMSEALEKISKRMPIRTHDELGARINEKRIDEIVADANQALSEHAKLGGTKDE